MTPTMAFAAFEVVALTAIAAGLLAGAGLASTGSGTSLAPRLRYGWAGGGAILVTLALLATGQLPDPGIAHTSIREVVHAGMIVLTAALMAALAVMDRNTAWAPDLVTLPLCITAAATGAILGGEAISFTTVLLGVAIWGGAQLLWLAQVLLRVEAVPPPDMMLLLAPLAMFGVELPLVIYFLIVAVALKACKAMPGVQRFFMARGLAEKVVADTEGHGNPQESVTFLAIGCPAGVIVLALSTAMGI